MKIRKYLATLVLLAVATVGWHMPLVCAQQVDYRTEVQKALDEANSSVQSQPDQEVVPAPIPQNYSRPPYPFSSPGGYIQNPMNPDQNVPQPFSPSEQESPAPKISGPPVGVITMKGEKAEEEKTKSETPAAAAEKIKEPEVPEVESKMMSRQKLIIDVLELKDMDVTDVLKLISKKSGLNIVSGKDVKGKVTIYLKEVEVGDALHIILESNDLAYIEEGGIIRVMTSKDYESTYGQRFSEKTKVKIIQLKNANGADVLALLNQMKSTIGKVIADDKSSTVVLIDTPERLKTMELFIKEIDVPIKTVVYDLSYAQAEEISKKIAEALTKNVGTIKFDQRSNKVIVIDTPAKLDEIDRMVKAFDEKHGEVLIESKIVQIILSDQYRMGVDWQAIVANYHNMDLKSTFNVLSETDKRGRLSIGTIASDDYTALVEALDTVGKTNILSSPHITAVNNKEAKILVGSTEPYVTTTTTTPATGPTTTAESVNFIDVGVKLYVTPTIHKDNFITLKIKPEVSSVVKTLTTGNNNKIPVVETSEAETTVLVKDGVTIVIGGLIKDEKVDSINKVPVLGDLPLIGFAFRNKDRFTRKTELVIFLTPKIITGDVAPSKQAQQMHDNIEQNTEGIFGGI